MTAHDDAMPDDLSDAEAFASDQGADREWCDKCGAAVWGPRDVGHKMGRLHVSDHTTADRWCRR